MSNVYHFKFEEKDHRYLLDGTEIPSVTQVLTAEGFIDARWYTDEGRARGLAVHIATHLYDEDDLDWNTVQPVIMPYLEAYVRFRGETVFVPQEIEVPHCHEKYRFGGRPDRRGKWKLTKGKILLDVKSGGVEPWAGLQLGGYELFYDDPSERYALELRSNGTYKLHPFEDRNDSRVFLSALACFNWKLKHGTKGGKS